MTHHFVNKRLLRPSRQTSSPSSCTENAHLVFNARENAATQEQASAADLAPTVATCFDRSQGFGVTLNPLINYSVGPASGKYIDDHYTANRISHVNVIISHERRHMKSRRSHGS